MIFASAFMRYSSGTEEVRGRQGREGVKDGSFFGRGGIAREARIRCFSLYELLPCLALLHTDPTLIFASTIALVSANVAAFVLFFDSWRYRQTAMHRFVSMIEERSVFGSSLPSS